MRTDEVTECFFCMIGEDDPVQTPLVCDDCGTPACCARGHMEHEIEGDVIRHVCQDCLDG